MSQNTLTVETFVREEQERLDSEKEQRLRDAGKTPFLKLPKGITRITLQKTIPKVSEYKGKQRKEVDITKSGEPFVWTMSPNSPVYREILKLLPKAPIVVEVMRMGEGMDTRYEIQVVP